MKAGYTDVNHAKLVARTEVMRAYRQSTLETYKANEVEKVIWLADNTAVTCIACWSMDGMIYDIDKVPGDHPNGRCTTIPLIDGLTEEELKENPELAGFSSEDKFKKLPLDKQIKVMGAGRHELWKSGKLPWRDIAGIRSSKDWGDTVRIVPLNELTDNSNSGIIKGSGYLPNKENLFIHNDKIEGYLLNTEHKDGKNKAFVIQKVLGYNVSNKELFVKELTERVQQARVSSTKKTEYGTKYTVKIEMQGLKNRTLLMNTGWQVDNGTDEPKLVTVTFGKKG